MNYFKGWLEFRLNTTEEKNNTFLEKLEDKEKDFNFLRW